MTQNIKRLVVGCVFGATLSTAISVNSAMAATLDVSPTIARDETAWRYVTISGLQSWVVENHAGERRIVYTTPDGMTLEGKLFNERGGDLTIALLRSTLSDEASAEALTDNGLAKIKSWPKIAPGIAQAAALSEPSSDTTAASQPNEQSDKTSLKIAPGLPPAGELSNEPPDAAAMSLMPKAASAAPASESPTNDTASSSGQQASDDDVPVLPAAADASELLKQAGGFTAWFSAGKPKPGAPVLYFMADPTCVHCAASTEKLAPKVASGDIDLRVILAPILSRQAVYQAASIIQSDAPASTFLSHEKSMVGTTPSTLDVLDPKKIEPDVVRALQRNVAWGRTNNVKGVPFWIYEGSNGPTFAAGRVTDDIINAAKPLPQDLAMETAQ